MNLNKIYYICMLQFIYIIYITLIMVYYSLTFIVVYNYIYYFYSGNKSGQLF